jgi:hypothetical protein
VRLDLLGGAFLGLHPAPAPPQEQASSSRCGRCYGHAEAPTVGGAVPLPVISLVRHTRLRLIVRFAKRAAALAVPLPSCRGSL